MDGTGLSTTSETPTFRNPAASVSLEWQPSKKAASAGLAGRSGFRARACHPAAESHNAGTHVTSALFPGGRKKTCPQVKAKRAAGGVCAFTAPGGLGKPAARGVGSGGRMYRRSDRPRSTHGDRGNGFQVAENDGALDSEPPWPLTASAPALHLAMVFCLIHSQLNGVSHCYSSGRDDVWAAQVLSSAGPDVFWQMTAYSCVF